MKLTNFAIAIAAIFPFGVKSDAIDMWMNIPHQDKLITGFRSSIEVAEGYAPVYTYWCAGTWNDGYFGLQRTAEDDYALIFTLWNRGNKTARILEAHPNAHVISCEHDCAEGSAAQAMVHGNQWQPGVSYQFQINVEYDGLDAIYTAQVFKDDKWQLLAKALGPGYGKLGLGYFSQFLETYESDYRYERRGIYSQQFYRVEGEDWEPVLSVSPFKNPNVAHLYYHYAANLTAENNGIILSLDGDGPGNDDPTTYTGTLHYDSKNVHLPDTTSSKPTNTLNEFPLRGMNASCSCTTVSSATQPFYMDDFLTAFQNQGYFWDTAARQNNTQTEFFYNGQSAGGRNFTAVTTIDTQKPYLENPYISGILYECFRNAEKNPSYGNVPIPSECSVSTKDNQVVAEVQFH